MTRGDQWWDTTALADMNAEQWESLCDGCGLCCLVKTLRNGKVEPSDVACRLLDIGSCRCRNYENRRHHVPDCVKLDASNVHTTGLLPESCAYRLIAEGKSLHWWHHLISGSRDTVHKAGISVRGAAVKNEGSVSLSRLFAMRRPT